MTTKTASVQIAPPPYEKQTKDISTTSSYNAGSRRYSDTYTTQGYDDGEEVDIQVPKENCSVLLPLDNSTTGLYVIYYYLKKIHKPENTVHACFVSDDFRSTRIIVAKNQQGSVTVTEKPKRKCCPCFKKKFTEVFDVGPSPGVLAELRKIDRMACIKVKHRVKHLFNKNGVVWDFRRLRGEDAGKAILDYRKSIGADIIIMGSRGVSLINNIVYGAVSTKVLNNSLVPVLVIRKPQGAMATETINKETQIE